MLVDTAGMKPHTKMSKTSADNFSLFRSEEAIEESDVVLLLLDATMGPTLQDKRIAGKILDAHKARVILCQKWGLAQEDDGLQVSTNPQTIRLFVNDPKLVTPAYIAFLEKNIRARFGLDGAPLRIFLKARTRKD